MSLSSRVQRAARCLAILAVVATASVPVAMSLGLDGAAYAQQGKRGGGNSANGGRGGVNPVLKCLGPDCVDVSKAQIPPCTHGYCEPPVQVYEHQDSCRVQVCDVIYGEKICWLERAYDVRTCQHQKERL